MVVVQGAGVRITMTVFYEKPWRGRGWVSSRGRGARSDWTAKATAQIGGGGHVGHLHYL